ncbi:DUF3501 family protein [Neptuniibacter sp. CAU 1671]|uniref:DUF3501 family protein n=1 Tax=Neptuniibacter sp. CAU 1671 TaxID=3032593 RepID=UPI0023DB851E|nr:DUF3501 family protein [Neptuniibacter sp. CAU 1671]MDF2180459.1 DUF3501 family protein [Neptuniibacter sp. CAU 1671]
MLTRADLYSLEEYAQIRPEFRRKVIAHKANRRLPLGEHAALYFESALTMQYQVQEMLRIERIFEQAGIQEELDVYNPLIPDGNNWKATFMLEFPDEHERRIALRRLVGIEQKLFLQIADTAPVYPIYNEDLDRSTEDKTAAVHFMRFELSPVQIMALQNGAELRAVIDHPAYQVDLKVPDPVRQALLADLQPVN